MAGLLCMGADALSLQRQRKGAHATSRQVTRLWLLAALLPTLCVPTSCAAAGSSARYFDIPAQELQSALNEFARQADRQILFSTSAVAVKRTEGVRGELASEAALRQLLRGTGLTYRVTADQTILAEEIATTTDAQLGSSEVRGPELLLEEVHVTGTFIRGERPIGTNVFTLSRQDIAATGAISASQLLANLPQAGDFNALPGLPENTQITIKRPNLRDLPGLNASGGSTTLVLLDGHRLVGSGILQTAADPDVIPPSVIERVEVIPDGGSATYGADAIGGVINFITRRHFDGVQASGRYGTAEDYRTYDLNLTAGHEWDDGSAYASFNYATHDDLFGRDREYIRHYGASGGPAEDLGCQPGNVTISRDLVRTSYAIPGLMPNTANTCDTSDAASFYPKETFQSVFAGLSQDFGASLQLDVRGFYSQRQVENVRGPFRTDGATIGVANPFYTRTADNPAPEPPLPQSVTFSWEPIFGPAALSQSTRLESWAVTPTLTFEPGRSWQIRALTNVGRSTTTAENSALNIALLDQALAATTLQTAINPYDIAATPNRELLANIANYGFHGEGEQQIVNYRAVADGELLPMPGGEVRVALGVEYLRESYRARSGDIVPGTQASLAWREAQRHNRSAFAEVSIPIVGENNRSAGIHSLALSVSARYDDYSDFGDTANPKYALTYEPWRWLTIRGNWGKSFNAPSLADAAGALNQVSIHSAETLPSPLPGEFVPAQAFWPLLALQGGVANIRPQTARTFSAGFDIRPSSIPRLTFSANYYRILLDDLIGFPPVFRAVDFYTHYRQFYILSPTQEQVLEAVQDTPVGQGALAGLFEPGDPPIYVLIDARRRNLGKARLSGIDYSVRYARATGFGSLDASFFSTYELERAEQPLPTLPWIDQLESEVSRFRFVAMLGADIGPWRAQAQWHHSEGFATQANALQRRIGSFDVVNLFLRYGVPDAGPLQALELTVQVNNVFDAQPPLLKGAYDFAGAGFPNGSTLGRLLQLGISKKF